jgi:hypothetical protein
MKMTSQDVLNILLTKDNKQDIIEAIEILCNPDKTAEECLRTYQKIEHKKQAKKRFREHISLQTR